jgi:hypothetical protein
MWKEMALVCLRGLFNHFSENNIKVRIAGFRRRNGTFEREEFNLYAAYISTIYSNHVGEHP